MTTKAGHTMVGTSTAGWRRIAGIALAAATVAGGLVIGSAPAAAAGTITPWSSSVALGATFSATANGCPADEEESDTAYTYRRAELLLITGTGADERVAAYGQQVDRERYRFRVPGWVDPDDDAVVAGRCVTTTYHFDSDDETVTTTFTFPDAAIDIVAGTATPAGPFVTVAPATLAGGQVAVISGTGCLPNGYLEAAVVTGGDLSGRTSGTFQAYGGGLAAADGSFEVEVALNSREYTDEDGAGPLDPGPYTVLTACYGEDEHFAYGEPQLLTIAGQFPSDQVTATVVDDEVTVAGSGCLPGETVTIRFRGYAYGGGYIELVEDQARALAQRSMEAIAQLTPGPDGDIDEEVTTVAEADGTWVATTPNPSSMFDLAAVATCGDPTTTGFRYVERYLYEDAYADLYVERVSPTSSPTGGTADVHLYGICDGEATVAVTTREGAVLSRSAPFAIGAYDLGATTVQLPDAAGTYRLVPYCDDEMGGFDEHTVFDPETLAAEAPLASEPSDGWPSEGGRETYEGRIGPIALPPMVDHEMGAEARALGPSGLFIDVPRPEGDFAITKMTFDLVDGDGNPVGPDAAHLHHFVIGDRSEKNPACPNGTFGLPGSIVAASGAERTVLELGDPYGLVVPEEADWTGVYDVMNLTAHAQEVYLSYDITYRRDVDNVRPITTYFGSTTGCSTYTWTIDGSGTPDTQSHYVTIAEGGRLVGAGGHVHNGGLHVDVVDDRGRRLCRSELQTGEPSMHGGHEEPMSDYPPEFYPDDPEIEGITTCALAERVVEGQRLRVDAVYENERARSGVMGIYTLHVWEGGGPEAAGPGEAPGIPGRPSYTG
ncbi:MAG: hypothetical protein KDA97_05715 [Acidimicrobiales bacterium]|nr:hypothetical protein [Acidimicrobiales bacterium]